jgi:HEAT repeat protein
MSLEMALGVSIRVVLTLFVAAAVFLLGHGLWRRGALRWLRPRMAAARAAITASLLADDPGAASLEPLRALSTGQRTRLLVEVSRSVSGETRMRLASIARDLGALAAARRRLRSRLWWRRLYAVRMLQSLDAEGRPYLPLLTDPHPAVRAQAAEWAAEEPDGVAAEALLGLLERADSLSRFTAQDSLLRLGPLAVDPISRYLAARDGAEVIPALEVAVALAQPSYAAPAARLCRSDDPEVRRLAVNVLGAIGGQEGTDALARLLGDPDLHVRAAAARALGRIGHWPAAAAVAALLRDPEWEVRQAAGFALRGLGSPGELMLRRYRQDHDRFAADMARQILDLPSGVEVPG